MTIKRNPILMFCFFQNLKRVRIRQALKLRLSNTYSVWDLAFSGAVFEDNSDPEFEEKLATCNFGSEKTGRMVQLLSED